MNVALLFQPLVSSTLEVLPGIHSQLAAILSGIPAGRGHTFNVTAHMVRRGRTVVGNTERLHRVVRRIAAGKCTRLVLLGGSVSHGFNVGGRQNSWAEMYRGWVNAAHPCTGLGR